MSERMFLTVDQEDIASCVSCGLCLPHCPTYRITGLDSHSPRGRIALVQAVREGSLDLDANVQEALDSCVQCMGCLPACPSSVRYDRIIHPVIEEIARSSRMSLLRRLVFAPLGRPLLLSVSTRVAAVAQRLFLLPSRIPAPRLGIRRSRLRDAKIRADADTVELLSGCVMGEWFGDVHKDTIRVLNAMGFNVRLTPQGACCGALHAHAGMTSRATKLLRRLSGRIDRRRALVTNSAGCGAHLETNGVDAVDVMDFIARHSERLPAAEGGALMQPQRRERILVHDACHLRNVLGRHTSTHEVLSRWFDLVTVPDEGLCCGAGGAYSIWHPTEARAILERKFDAMRTLDLSDVSNFASGNPGCSGHIAAHLPAEFSRLQVVHPVQLVARILDESQTARQ